MRLGHVVCVGLVSLLIVAPVTSAVGGQDPGETSYVVSPAELKLDFMVDGAFDVTLPGYGNVVVEGVSENPPSDPVYIRAEDADEVERSKKIPGRDGAAVPSPHPMIEGHVVGHPDSDADVVLGKYGVYGRIEVNGTIFEFNPRKGSNGVFVQHVDTKTGLAQLPPKSEPDRDLTSKLPDFPVDRSHGASSSDVYMDMEPSFYDNVGDPVSRVESAFNQYDDLYQDSATNVPLNLYNVWKTGEEITPGTHGDDVDGTNAVQAYRDWLDGGMLVDGIDAYQLWTGVDLEDPCETWPDDSCLYGIAYQADAADGHHGWADSSSVVEGIDYYFDGYDPDEVHDRGIVSGHELGHLYGQEHHPDDTGTIMEDGPMGDETFDFVDDSVNEIYHRYHEDYEWDEDHWHR